jgi:SAM-dependent methyltransferase
MLRRGGIENGLVVDLGCGSGIWARELANAGYAVLGVDISPAMIAIARVRVAEAEFVAKSYLNFKLPECRAVTSLGEVFNYLFDKQNGFDALGRLFQRVYSALGPSGLFIFDVAEPERKRGDRQTFCVDRDWAALVEFEHDVGRSQLTRRIVTFRKVGKLYRRHDETHHLQLFRGSEIAEVLREVGFRVRIVRGYGDYPLPQGLVGFVARKP